MWSRIGEKGEKRWGKKGAGIFFTDGKKVLILKRSEKGDNQGKWSLPGGKIEEGESAIDAAKREAKEECGKLKGQRFEYSKEKDGLFEWTTFFFKIEKPFKCKLSDEHTEYKWVKILDLENYDLHPKFKKNLKRYIYILNNSKSKGLINFKKWLESVEVATKAHDEFGYD